MGSVLLYGVTGSLDIAVIGPRLAQGGPVDPVALVGTAMLLAGFLSEKVARMVSQFYACCHIIKNFACTICTYLPQYPVLLGKAL